MLVPKSQGEPGQSPAEQINVTLNWFEERKRVPVKRIRNASAITTGSGNVVWYDQSMSIDKRPARFCFSSDIEAFEAAARRPLQQRIHRSFIHTFKPVLDEAPYRSFESTAAYRKWCAQP